MAETGIPPDSPLGKPTEYIDTYTPSLLSSMERADARVPMGIPDTLPFRGEDVWNAFEFTWLNERGKPQVCALRINVPAVSPCIVESKSMKLYLGSFRNHGAFHEDCTLSIAERLIVEITPRWLRIGGYWYPRGGMPIDVFYQTGPAPAGVWIPDQGVAPYRGRG